MTETANAKRIRLMADLSLQLAQQLMATAAELPPEAAAPLLTEAGGALRLGVTSSSQINTRIFSPTMIAIADAQGADLKTEGGLAVATAIHNFRHLVPPAAAKDSYVYKKWVTKSQRQALVQWPMTYNGEDHQTKCKGKHNGPGKPAPEDLCNTLVGYGWAIQVEHIDAGLTNPTNRCPDCRLAFNARQAARPPPPPDEAEERGGEDPSPQPQGHRPRPGPHPAPPRLHGVLLNSASLENALNRRTERQPPMDDIMEDTRMEVDASGIPLPPPPLPSPAPTLPPPRPPRPPRPQGTRPPSLWH
jgi:hypothetical protein